MPEIFTDSQASLIYLKFKLEKALCVNQNAVAKGGSKLRKSQKALTVSVTPLLIQVCF